MGLGPTTNWRSLLRYYRGEERQFLPIGMTFCS